MRRFIPILLTSLMSAPLFGAAPAHTAPQRWHIDRPAGIKFMVPMHHPKEVLGEAIEAAVRKQLGAAYPKDVRFTSGVYDEGNIPYVIVWTKKVKGGVSRGLADDLQEQPTKAEVAQGLQNFTFRRDELRGEGDLPEQGGLKAKVLVQLVKDRCTYVGFYYHTPAQLAEFDVIKRSMHPGRLSKLNYEALPRTSGPSTVLAWVTGILGTLAALGLMAGAAFYGYVRMGRRDKESTDAAAEDVGREVTVQ